MRVKISKKEARKIDLSTWGWVSNNGDLGKFLCREVNAAIREQLQDEDNGIFTYIHKGKVVMSLPFGKEEDLDVLIAVSLTALLEDHIEDIDEEDEALKLRKDLLSTVKKLDALLNKIRTP